MLTTERINEITIEETLDITPKSKDTAEEAKFRRDVRKDIAAIKLRGGQVQLPNDEAGRNK
jgi:hypothetical protein